MRDEPFACVYVSSDGVLSRCVGVLPRVVERSVRPEVLASMVNRSPVSRLPSLWFYSSGDVVSPYTWIDPFELLADVALLGEAYRSEADEYERVRVGLIARSGGRLTGEIRDAGHVSSSAARLSRELEQIAAGKHQRSAKHGGRGTKDVWIGGHKAAASEAMGMDWATLAELSEAIPPAYTKFLGYQMHMHLMTTQRRAA